MMSADGGSHPNVCARWGDFDAMCGLRPCVLAASAAHLQAIGQQPQQAPNGAQLHYECRRTEKTMLHRLVQQHAASFLSHTEASTGSEWPSFMNDEFDVILTHGFPRLRCGDCGHKLLAFSCKRRGFRFPAAVALEADARCARSYAAHQPPSRANARSTFTTSERASCD
jgi:hypothetical protein